MTSDKYDCTLSFEIRYLDLSNYLDQIDIQIFKTSSSSKFQTFLILSVATSKTKYMELEVSSDTVTVCIISHTRILGIVYDAV